MTPVQIVAKVAKTMKSVPADIRADESLQIGRWQLDVSLLFTLCLQCFGDIEPHTGFELAVGHRESRKQC